VFITDYLRELGYEDSVTFAVKFAYFFSNLYENKIQREETRMLNELSDYKRVEVSQIKNQMELVIVEKYKIFLSDITHDEKLERINKLDDQFDTLNNIEQLGLASLRLENNFVNSCIDNKEKVKNL
jgi:hypothetical protein